MLVPLGIELCEQYHKPGKPGANCRETHRVSAENSDWYVMTDREERAIYGGIADPTTVYEFGQRFYDKPNL
jgi:hypothetical protein